MLAKYMGGGRGVVDWLRDIKEDRFLCCSSPYLPSTLWWQRDHVEVVMTRMVDNGELDGNKSFR